MDKVDDELRALIEDVIAAGLLADNPRGLAVAQRVAAHGFSALQSDERGFWEQDVLPVLSKPLQEQIAIASILRSGGYVPRKINY
ncbi:hypothetical protein Sa4125_25690 [Aureimonas sp. SA4125]|uniref:hypothetical protein n=1 Tax=Aureimonas sp. SA4125 TaxID=2826993 RepID=UPI001CC38DF7|nr:hypothetical protein [Aureimonas sp. SA4125]BDA85027.1 hypothetical protein Sa4125_25690 [Aureimonas sp. SA4125]